VEEKLVEAAINAGTGAIIAVVIIYLAYRLILKLVTGMGAEVVKSFTAQADALTRQAASMESLTNSLQEYVLRDNEDHRDIKIMLRVLIDRSERNLERTLQE